MINQLLKIGFFYQVWRWFKPRSKLLLVASLIIFLTWLLHAEFTDYLGQLSSIEESASDTLLGISYLVKWATILVVVFFIYVSEKLRLKSNRKSSIAEETIARNLRPEQPINQLDPFQKIRQKKQLETRAEKLLK